MRRKRCWHCGDLKDDVIDGLCADCESEHFVYCTVCKERNHRKDADMRKIETHKVNGLNDALEIIALDGPGAGGASHEYQIVWRSGPPTEPAPFCAIKFQDGPIAESGVNGVSNEALLAVVIDRLQGFQNGDYKCRENAIALTKLEEAMHWLQHRTRERTSRGVEGTSAK